MPISTDLCPSPYIKDAAVTGRWQRVGDALCITASVIKRLSYKAYLTII